MSLNPKRTIAELKELRSLTANSKGAQRVAWTDTWLKAREWFEAKLADLPVEHHFDAAGNHWITLQGASPQALIIGSHLDSVPNGGWLDGCLGVLAGLEVLRRWVEVYDGKPPITLRLVDWADEEGARFGRSLFGSSAFSGTLNIAEEMARVDKDGVHLQDALSRCGVDINQLLEAQTEQENAAAYLELHIEQGPVLESLRTPLGVVQGTKGVERNLVTFIGQEAHAGSTPMRARHDALAAAAKLALEIRPIAMKHPNAVCTMGSVRTLPGIATAVVGRCEAMLDQRDLDKAVLTQLKQDATDASYRFAAEEECSVKWSKIYRIDPIPFDPELIELCAEAIQATAKAAPQLPSGPLHDAAEVARAGIPTAMIFVQSRGGISHNKIEDSDEEHLRLAVIALDRLATKTAEWIATK